jgi:hypothetical protein
MFTQFKLQTMVRYLVVTSGTFAVTLPPAVGANSIGAIPVEIVGEVEHHGLWAQTTSYISMRDMA